MTVAETTGLLQLTKSCCSKVLGWCRTGTTSCEMLGALLQQFADERCERDDKEDEKEMQNVELHTNSRTHSFVAVFVAWLLCLRLSFFFVLCMFNTILFF